MNSYEYPYRYVAVGWQLARGRGDEGRARVGHYTRSKRSKRVWRFPANAAFNSEQGLRLHSKLSSIVLRHQNSSWLNHMSKRNANNCVASCFTTKVCAPRMPVDESFMQPSRSHLRPCSLWWPLRPLRPRSVISLPERKDFGPASPAASAASATSSASAASATYEAPAGPADYTSLIDPAASLRQQSIIS
jgi:hypothetical protein